MVIAVFAGQPPSQASRLLGLKIGLTGNPAGSVIYPKNTLRASLIERRDGVIA